MKLAIFSNININPLIRILSKQYEVFETEGYGNEIGTLLNPQASLYSFMPESIFIMEDLTELLQHDFDKRNAEVVVDNWFQLLGKAIKEAITYYIADVYFYCPEFEVTIDKGLKLRLEQIWEKHLSGLAGDHENVRIFRYRSLIEKIGEEQAFSMKMWYMGKIPYSVKLQKILCDEISRQLELLSSVPKKVLALDLDNTLWGGLAVENEENPVVLSEDGAGLVYKNFQRMILEIRKQGVILGIVSKNNMEDAMRIIRNHPHMILKEDDFVSIKINWKRKYENLIEMAEELNLGLDSFVFIDDSPAERKLVKEFLPDVVVPEFPKQLEKLPEMLLELYQDYFERNKITDEDQKKTEMYQANRKRENLKATVLDYKDYLNSLEIRMKRVDARLHKSRFMQLVNKTNQFNLTGRRFTEQEIEEIFACDEKEVFLYQVEDCFGDNGIVCASIVDYQENATIVEFTMSCRVMGRQIENAVLQEMEEEARKKGYKKMVGLYCPNKKNKPVSALYTSCGYREVENDLEKVIVYEIDISERINRDHQVKILEGN